ncbi:hypothetical protein [Nocardia anaemiae]|uniref:hypothetical protein n=1 Tax=Nocardia anaemiae TaxID=263910 RepID=UPI0012F4ADD3|nr:hypothetical protein [Nocardia anaemiae]
MARHRRFGEQMLERRPGLSADSDDDPACVLDQIGAGFQVGAERAQQQGVGVLAVYGD